MIEIEVQARGVIAAGLDGQQFDANLPRFGAYVLFARNVSSIPQVRTLCDALGAHGADAGVPALVAIDQEGGRVARLRDGVEALPSMMALGAAGDLELARRAGEQSAYDLRRAGCTLNLAPVLDLALHPENTVIGTRSFGSQAARVAALGAAFAAGLEAGGIVPCYKHFPGHGATPTDSHVASPVIDAGADELRRRDLIPFAAVAPRAAAIMGTHAVVRAFDARGPATLSYRIATELLRGELGFGGVLITDCLQMSALDEYGSPGRAAIAALTAGADLLTVSHSVDLAQQIVAEVVRAVAAGTLARTRLQEAYGRVRRLRRLAVPAAAAAAHPGIGREIARRAITLVRGCARADPGTTAIVSFAGAVSEGINVQSLPDAASLRREAPSAHEIGLPLDPVEADVETALRDLRAGCRRPLLLARRAHLHPGQARAIGRIVAEYPDATVVSMLEPYDLPLFTPYAANVLAAYGDDPAALGGLADVLFGGRRPEGRLPVELPA